MKNEIESTNGKPTTDPPIVGMQCCTQAVIPVKKCNICQKEKPANYEHFHKQKKGKYGYRSTCKSCLKIKRREYTSTDEYKKKHREKMSEWRKNNPEKALEISRRSYKRNGWKDNEKKREKLRTDEEYQKKVRERERKYVESGRRAKMNRKPETKEKARIRSSERRKNPEKKQHDYERMAKWRNENKEYLLELHKNRRENLSDSYVAQSMRKSVDDVPKEVLELKKLIIQFKRELKSNNIKIR